MKLRAMFSIFFILSPLFMFAHITGTYQVFGFDFATQQPYTGTVVIQKQNATYTAIWTFDEGGTDVGTGVKHDDSIAFVFNENGSANYGVQLYEIDRHSLKGPWTRFGTDTIGIERIVRLGGGDFSDSHLFFDQDPTAALE
jgi:hypothetical protein